MLLGCTFIWSNAECVFSIIHHVVRGVLGIQVRIDARLVNVYRNDLPRATLEVVRIYHTSLAEEAGLMPVPERQRRIEGRSSCLDQGQEDGKNYTIDLLMILVYYQMKECYLVCMRPSVYI